MDFVGAEDVVRFSQNLAMGCMQTTPPVRRDLGEAMGEAPGRRNPAERTMDIHLGLAIEDGVEGVMIWGRATRLGPGRRSPL